MVDVEELNKERKQRNIEGQAFKVEVPLTAPAPRVIASCG